MMRSLPSKSFTKVVRHGMRSCYVRGCRCNPCREANRLAYHARQRRAVAAALELPAPTEGIAQAFTGPDGTVRLRFYKHACPGVNGRPCPKRAHLRRDSKGGCCEACRLQLVWNGLVDAAPVRAHLKALSTMGVGYKSVATAADVSRTTLAKILAGRRSKIRMLAAARVLAVDRDARADHSLVRAGRTWSLIGRLLDEGFSKAAIARRLGARTPALQIGRQRVLAKTALRVSRLYWKLMVA